MNFLRNRLHSNSSSSSLSSSPRSSRSSSPSRSRPSSPSPSSSSSSSPQTLPPLSPSPPPPAFSSSSSSHLGEALWKAASENNLAVLNHILSSCSPSFSSSAHLNWSDSEHGRTAFYRACSHGHLEVVSLLSSDPRVHVNQTNTFGATPFFLACQQGHAEVVKLMLRHPRVDVNKPDDDLISPFFMVCARGNLEVAKLLLLDRRIEVNSPTKTNTTALWFASQEGHMEIVEWILAARETVNISLKTIPGQNGWNGKSAKEIAQRRGHEEIAKLLERYEKEPEKLRFELRKKHRLLDSAAAEVFALTVFYCDGYLTLRPWLTSKTEKKAARFFHISSQLPMDLQMTLANRLHQLSKDWVTLEKTEEACRLLVTKWSK